MGFEAKMQEVLTEKQENEQVQKPTTSSTGTATQTPTATTFAPVAEGNIHQISVKMAENERYAVICLELPQLYVIGTIAIGFMDENGTYFSLEHLHGDFGSDNGNSVKCASGWLTRYENGGSNERIGIQVKVEGEYVYYTVDKSALGTDLSKSSLRNINIYTDNDDVLFLSVDESIAYLHGSNGFEFSDNQKVYLWDGEYEIDEGLLKYAVLDYWNYVGVWTIEYGEKDGF